MSGRFSLDTLGAAGDLGALAHYADAEYYANTYADRRQDVDWYVRQARRAGGPVLECGVGTGRVALAVAAAGVELTGVDLSRPMLRACEERLGRLPRHVRERVTLVQGDLRTVRLGQRFRLVMAPFNVLLHLYQRPELEAFLAGVREHLEPGAELAFDASVPQPADLARDPDQLFPADDVVDPTTGKRCRYTERFEYDPIRQLLLVSMQFSPVDGSEPWVVPLTHRQYFPQELEALLHYNGFEAIRFTADFGDDEPDAHTDSLVVRCRARP